MKKMWMNPLVVQILNSIVRAAVLFALGALVTQGVMSQDEADKSAAQLSELLVPIVGSMLAAAVAWYGARRAKQQQTMLITAQAMPAGVSTKQVLEAIKNDKAPDATLPRNQAPDPIPRSAGTAKPKEKDDGSE